MSRRNNFWHNGGRHQLRYRQRGDLHNNRPESNCRSIDTNSIDTIARLINHHSIADRNSTQELSSTRRTFIPSRGRRPTRLQRNSLPNQTGWWSVTIQQADSIGKERVMSALQVHCIRQFQPYHYFIDLHTKAGVFFVNNQQDADMIKRANGKVEVQNLDILRIIVSRVSAPIPILDEDLRPHFKDHLLNRRFNQQTHQLDLSNLADDYELNSLGIFPQFNKHVFTRAIVDIINKNFPMTRQLDLGSNNITNLFEFRNLHLDNLIHISFASNQLKNIENFDNLKQLTHLIHINIQNNPIIPSNNQNTNSIDEIISTIHKKLPQLKRINDTELRPIIGFGTDIITYTLPKSLPHHVPDDIQGFLTKFIDQYYSLFDTSDRGELHTCYHDLCMFSLCISTYDGSLVPVRHYKYGQLIYDSRNLQKIYDDNKRMSLLKHGKTNVMNYLRVKFPITKHDGTSFHVDVISTANNRAIFTINGLYREVDQGTNNSPIRYFQRTFTCVQTTNSVLIIADHIMLSNPTDAQISNMSRPSASTISSQTIKNSNESNINIDIQNQMIQQFSQQSGMNFQYSKLCLQEHNWNYDKSAEVFLDLKQKNMIPPEAFNNS